MKFTTPTLVVTIAVLHTTSVNAAFTHQHVPCRSLACQSLIPTESVSRNANTRRMSLSSLNAARTIFQEIDEFFDDYASFPSSIFDSSDSISNRGLSSSRNHSNKRLQYNTYESMLRRSSPRYDIVEHDGGCMINLDVPGVRASDVKIEYKPSTKVLHISGGRKMQQHGRTVEKYYEKHFKLADYIDVQAISASFVDGVLSLTLPKNSNHEEVQSITITEGIKGDTTQLSVTNDSQDTSVEKSDTAASKDTKEASVETDAESNVENEENTIEL